MSVVSLALPSFVGLIVAHLLMIRVNRLLGWRVSPQLLLLALVALGNIPLLFLAALKYNAMSWSIQLNTYAYLVIVYNCLAYSYFHFFNMSETARRIRLLINLKLNGGVALAKPQADYQPGTMVRGRIERLLGLGQIEQLPNGNYRIKRRLFLNVARFISWWAKLTGMRTSYAN
jgi:hypothetical protein